MFRWPVQQIASGHVCIFSSWWLETSSGSLSIDTHWNQTKGGYPWIRPPRTVEFAPTSSHSPGLGKCECEWLFVSLCLPYNRLVRVYPMTAGIGSSTLATMKWISWKSMDGFESYLSSEVRLMMNTTKSILGRLSSFSMGKGRLLASLLLSTKSDDNNGTLTHLRWSSHISKSLHNWVIRCSCRITVQHHVRVPQSELHNYLIIKSTLHYQLETCYDIAVWVVQKSFSQVHNYLFVVDYKKYFVTK